MVLVGLVGVAGAGKDSFARPAIERYGFVRVGFSDPLKEAVSVLFGWPREDLQRMEFKEAVDPFWGTTPRKVLQWFGTEVFRQLYPRSFPESPVGEDFWVQLFRRRVQGLDRVVVPDVRFENEARAILGLGGHLVWVVREGEGWGTACGSHPSESLECRSLATWVYRNDGSLADWVSKANQFWASLVSPSKGEGVVPEGAL